MCHLQLFNFARSKEHTGHSAGSIPPARALSAQGLLLAMSTPSTIFDQFEEYLKASSHHLPVTSEFIHVSA